MKSQQDHFPGFKKGKGDSIHSGLNEDRPAVRTNIVSPRGKVAGEKKEGGGEGSPRQSQGKSVRQGHSTLHARLEDTARGGKKCPSRGNGSQPSPPAVRVDRVRGRLEREQKRLVGPNSGKKAQRHAYLLTQARKTKKG